MAGLKGYFHVTVFYEYTWHEPKVVLLPFELIARMMMMGHGKQCISSASMAQKCQIVGLRLSSPCHRI